MTDLQPDDLHDISDLVTPVIAESPLLPGTAFPCFTNGKSFFFTDSQINDVAQLLTAGHLRRRAGSGWEEVVPDKGLRYLAERHINGTAYFRLRKYWKFTVTAS